MVCTAQPIADARTGPFYYPKEQTIYLDLSFTHGTSEQRMRWFMKGLRSGRLEDGDETFTLPYDRL